MRSDVPHEIFWLMVSSRHHIEDEGDFELKTRTVVRLAFEVGITFGVYD